jgi:hypothetical protein
MSDLKQLREEVYEANMELVRRGLVLYTLGNVGGILRARTSWPLSRVDSEQKRPRTSRWESRAGQTYQSTTVFRFLKEDSLEACRMVIRRWAAESRRTGIGKHHES